MREKSNVSEFSIKKDTRKNYDSDRVTSIDISI